MLATGGWIRIDGWSDGREERGFHVQLGAGELDLLRERQVSKKRKNRHRDTPTIAHTRPRGSCRYPRRGSCLKHGQLSISITWFVGLPCTCQVVGGLWGGKPTVCALFFSQRLCSAENLAASPSRPRKRRRARSCGGGKHPQPRVCPPVPARHPRLLRQRLSRSRHLRKLSVDFGWNVCINDLLAKTGRRAAAGFFFR